MANNPKFNLHLEALRGAAAMLVLFTHLIAKLPYFNFNNRYFIRLVDAWGTEAVIIFFVLSGIVIHASFEKTQRSNFGFLINRIIRLHPILIISVIFTILIEKFGFSNHIDAWQLAGNIIPVSTFSASLAPLYFQSNPVIWSLSFEMFFYVVFAIGGIYKRTINWLFIKLWFVLSLLSIAGYYLISSIPLINYLLQMMAFSGIWLTGFFIWSIKDKCGVSLCTALFSFGCLPLISRLHLTTDYYDPIKYLFFAIASVPSFIYLCRLNADTKSNRYKDILGLIPICAFLLSCVLIMKDNSYKTGIKLVYISLPFGALLFYNKIFKNIVKEIYYKWLLTPLSYIGKLSYSIYIIHFPVLIVIALSPFPIYFKPVIAIAAIFSFSILLENYFQPLITRLSKGK